ncbi:hypothetical protein B0H10DRAFT_1942976 [Mycena sp. CBHHK59/15]|nr:hypothetical protein B0H10DRAFT_1942976 [Mycena sp. CBHHK59/15]
MGWRTQRRPYPAEPVHRGVVRSCALQLGTSNAGGCLGGAIMLKGVKMCWVLCTRSSCGILIPQPSKPIPVSRSARVICICYLGHNGRQTRSFRSAANWTHRAEVCGMRNNDTRSMHGRRAMARAHAPPRLDAGATVQPGAGLGAGSVKTTRVGAVCRHPGAGHKLCGSHIWVQGDRRRVAHKSGESGVLSSRRVRGVALGLAKLSTNPSHWMGARWVGELGRASEAGLWDSSVGWVTNGCRLWDWHEAVQSVWADRVADRTHAVLGHAEVGQRGGGHLQQLDVSEARVVHVERRGEEGGASVMWAMSD